jgi:sugar phosphate isomerase/epimerase
MADHVAVILYSVRDLLPTNFEGVVRKLAAMGYEGVEMTGFAGTTPKAAAKLFKELHLAVTSAHVFPPPTGDSLKKVVDDLAELGTKTVVSGFGPDRYKTLDATRQACDELNAAAKVAEAAGLRFCVHNHDFEYYSVEGSHPYKIMLDKLDPKVGFELDTYWIKTGGCDPAAVVKEVGKRAPLLHIKDGPAVRGKPMVAVGDGAVDFPAVIKAGKGATEWLIVEFDECATDIMVALEKSCKYLKSL